jgi:XTP/dITP diphosphohydrolase
VISKTPTAANPLSTLVLASGNQGKLKELQAHFDTANLGLTLKLQSEFGLDSADETACTFIENALLKARHASKQTGLPALSDDSGLSVPALNGAPGIYSARYAGEGASDAENNQKLIEAITPLLATGKVAAQFVCVLTLVRYPDDPLPIIAQGLWHGTLTNQAAGSGGFGYDPLFIPDGLTITSSELPREHKAQISHRALALKALCAQLSGSSGFSEI